ncbi:phospholipase D-like domain-containing protein [uncultured Sulfitobacter sp.]|uniref:phospholipase D-like domain-containing protein n=1 Tax=uncultured Sulfitobacter sp. TaxID=191468 RepID=UPI002611F327|nr:phospholipase D-like domain-containing protein [uncultured Sulfitobacter sp.]
MNNERNKTEHSRHWRVERADNFALIVDACRYFIVLREVIIAAQQQLLLIGWDFDLEIEMLPGESDAEGNAPDGLPNKLGPFLEEVIRRTPDLHIYMLKWNGSILVAPGRLAPTAALAAFGSDRIHLALDGHHPFGACHHQKIVVADDCVAFCGGIDATENRWDTPEHLPDDPRRVCKDGSPSEPWHDATSAVSGPAAAALGALSRERWSRARSEELEVPTKNGNPIWPEDLEVAASDIDVAIARTKPPFEGAPLVNEIEEAFLYAIKTAQRSIYIESQYFAADTICAALEARLTDVGGPQIVIVNPQTAMSAFEDDAMHEVRDIMINRLNEADHENRFRIWHPVTSAEQPIYVHAKILITDGTALHIGSANMNNRSLGFDTECNVIVDTKDDFIGAFQNRLVSEHLGVTPEKFADVLAQERSLIDAIEALNSKSGRGLRVIEERESSMRSTLLAQTRFMDPRYHPGEETSTGEGIRPRHIGIMVALGLLGYLGWAVWP